jgi:hypothetical protein
MEIGSCNSSGQVIFSKTTLGLYRNIPVDAKALEMFFSVKEASYKVLNIG